MSADTIVPQPGNPQSLNRYSYVLGNPLRYSDPTGYFSEEEITGFFGVETWEEVLAFFEEGRTLEGRWGWLEVLRQAKESDNLFVSESGWPFRELGYFAVFDDKLLIDAHGYRNMFEVATQYDYYSIRRSTRFTSASDNVFTTEAHQIYYHRKINWGKVDWIDAGLDTAGIIADVATVGLAGRAANAIKIAKNAGNVLDCLDVAYGNAQFWSQVRNLDSWDALGFASDIWGLVGPPIVPDLLGIGINLQQATYVTP